MSKFEGWELAVLQQKAADLNKVISDAHAERLLVIAALAPKLSSFKAGQVIKRKSSSTYLYIKSIGLIVNDYPYKDYLIKAYRVESDGSLGRFEQVAVNDHYKATVEAGYEVIPAKLIDNRVVFDEPRRVRIRAVDALQLPARVADNAELVSQLKRPRVERGVDYGNERLILIKCGDEELTWEKGSKFFAGIGRQSYAPTSLVYRNHDKSERVGIGGVTGDDWHEGGKLSKKLLGEFDAKISDTFGVDFNFSEVYVPGTTLVIYGKD